MKRPYKICYLKSKNSVNTRRSRYIEHMINQGLDIEIIEYVDKVRGRNRSIIIINELSRSSKSE